MFHNLPLMAKGIFPMPYCLKGRYLQTADNLTLYDVEGFINILLLYAGDTIECIRNTSVTTAFSLLMYNKGLPALELRSL